MTKGAIHGPEAHPSRARPHADFPEGSPSHGYEFVAPLDPKGHLDSSEWPQAKGACTVRRFWNHEPDEHGALIHRRNGSWAFSYAPGDDDDEPIFRFDRHLFVEGEYVTVTEHDGAGAAVQGRACGAGSGSRLTAQWPGRPVLPTCGEGCRCRR